MGNIFHFLFPRSYSIKFALLALPFWKIFDEGPERPIQTTCTTRSLGLTGQNCWGQSWRTLDSIHSFIASCRYVCAQALHAHSAEHRIWCFTPTMSKCEMARLWRTDLMAVPAAWCPCLWRSLETSSLHRPGALVDTVLLPSPANTCRALPQWKKWKSENASSPLHLRHHKN